MKEEISSSLKNIITSFNLKKTLLFFLALLVLIFSILALKTVFSRNNSGRDEISLSYCFKKMEDVQTEFKLYKKENNRKFQKLEKDFTKTNLKTKKMLRKIDNLYNYHSVEPQDRQFKVS